MIDNSYNDAIYNGEYQTIIQSTLNKALMSFRRIIAIRIDLRYPAEMDRLSMDSSDISKFRDILQSQILADVHRKEIAWNRSLHHHLYFVWVREFGLLNNRKHYHEIIFLNKDIYQSLGDFNEPNGTLAVMIRTAWCRALGLEPELFSSLVHFSANPFYFAQSDPMLQDKIREFINYANYLAKHESKHYSDGYRSIGSSR